MTKLFNVVRPDVAIFGEKDYQQLQIIRRLVRDLLMDVEIVGYPIVRESDGVAMSSRNAYLNADERKAARCLSRSLQQGRMPAPPRRGVGENHCRAVIARAPKLTLGGGDYVPSAMSKP